MSSIQVKNIPDELHDRVRARAAERSLTVRDYLLDLMRRDLEKPTLSAWLEQLRADDPVDVTSDEIVEIIRSGREERGEELMRRLAR